MPQTKEERKLKENIRKVEWNKNNPESYVESRKAWALRNPEKVKAAQKKWRSKNREKHCEMVAKWHRNNPGPVDIKNIRKNIASSLGIERSAVSIDVIESHLAVLKVKRLIRELSKCV